MRKNLVHYQSGERIINAGDQEKKMYIILDGQVSITLSDGKNTVTVADLKVGDFFGEISLFNNIPRSANVNAVTDVKLFYIDSVEELTTFLVKNPAFAAKMVRILAQRLAKTDEILIGKISEINRLKLLRP